MTIEPTTAHTNSRDRASDPYASILAHAQRLVDSRTAGGGFDDQWSHEAHHVGDMSVLAIAFRDRA